MDNNLPRVDIILVNWNNYHFTKPCIESLFKSTYPNIKIYVVDNGSKKEVVEQLKNDFGKRITIFENKRNLGFGEGNNVALRKVKGKYSMILNNDTVVGPGWLEPLVEEMEKDANIGACQPKVKWIKDRRYFEHAGAAGGFMDVYGYPFARGRVFSTVEEDRGQYDDSIEVVWCSGTAMMLRNSILKDTGFFDPIFFIYAEEADLCWRIAHSGYKMMCFPKSVIYHYGMGTMEKTPVRKTYLTHKNGIIMLLKNYTWKELLKHLPVRIILDIISILYYFLTRPLQGKYLSVAAAYFMLLFSLPRVFKSRCRVQRLKKRFAHKSTIYPLYKCSIVVKYYLQKKKTYNQIVGNCE